tara:strand:+ start:96 stop:332 length:237 start_codon:yes stop_codon:yes gene_type:complete
MIFGYLEFLKGKNIFPQAIAMIVGSLVMDMINRVKDDIILPLSRLELKEIYKRVSIREYIGLMFNFLLQTFILWLISQ